MGNKIKKLVAGITLGLMVVAGAGVGGQAVRAVDSGSTVEVIDGTIVNYYGEDDVTYEENTRDTIEALVESGHMTRREADLELAFMDAETHEEKQKTYEAIVDYHVEVGNLTEDEGKKLKEAGYDAPWDAVQLDDYLDYLDDMVKEGVMTQREADLEKTFLTAKTDDERQKAYDNLIDYYVEVGYITDEEGKEIKELGYVI